MFGLLKSWDNRKVVKRTDCIKGRTWTRRIRWFYNQDDVIKLKLEDGTQYKEVLVMSSMVDVVWNRFKEGQSIDDCVSLLGQYVPQHMASRKANL